MTYGRPKQCCPPAQADKASTNRGLSTTFDNADPAAGRATQTPRISSTTKSSRYPAPPQCGLRSGDVRFDPKLTSTTGRHDVGSRPKTDIAKWHLNVSSRMLS